MSAGNNRTPGKKTGTTPPRKVQKSLTYFFSTPSSSRLSENSASRRNISHTSESQGNQEIAKKRKIGQSNGHSGGRNQRKSEETHSDATNKLKLMELIDLTEDGKDDYQIESWPTNKIANKKSNPANVPLSRSKICTNNDRLDVFIMEDGANKRSGNSICNNIDPDRLENIKLPGDLAWEENSLAGKVSKIKSPLEKPIEYNPRHTAEPRRLLPLKSKSRNTQYSLKIEKESDSLEESSTETKLDEKKSVKREKIPSISDLKNDMGKKLGKENIAKDKPSGWSFDDDDFLFEEVDDKLLKDEDEMEKASKDSGCNSQSIGDTLTDDFEHLFNDDWSGDMETGIDLSTPQRCKISDISRDKSNNLIANVILVESNIHATVMLMDCWRAARIKPGDSVYIKAAKPFDTWVIDTNNGTLVENPDLLLSGTLVVSAIFCRRRAVLSDTFKGIETMKDCKRGTSPMVIGNLLHGLLQEVLKKEVQTTEDISKLMKDILDSKETANMLYSASMTKETCEKEMSPYVSQISEFVKRDVKDKNSKSRDQRLDGNFNGKIIRIMEIEENLWAPNVGLKGKVDVTVEVGGSSKPRIMPLELKTGRASFSLEHKGQVILYTMMMEATGQPAESGLLLYLRDNILHEVRMGHHERRDLTLLRNELAYYLTRKPEMTSQTDIEMDLELPGPIRHPACATCPYNAVCGTYLKTDKSIKLDAGHPLIPIMEKLETYLRPEHIKYVKGWVRMLQVEKADELNSTRPLKSIWTVAPAEREKSGKCLSNLKINGEVIEKGNRYLHTFVRADSNASELMKDFTKSGFTSMEYSIVSTNTKVKVCAGPIVEISKDSITVSLERDLVKKKPNETYHIDGYAPQNLLALNLSNVGYLLDDNPITDRIRRIVIERQPSTSNKLDRSVFTAASEILKPLNPIQRRAVLTVIAADDYLLIKGMPGSGKTLTIVAIIQLLVKLEKSVLLTAHTHSAVDNVLLKLIKTDVDFVRLGATNKIHPSLLSKSESVLTQECYTPESLDAAYSGKNVVAVTCLGANHPLLGKRMFDVCVVDESTQVLQSSILRPLFSASKFVLIGDPNQLAPVVTTNIARELGMGESLFERLDSENNTIALTAQYRMNQRIMFIANQVTYEGQLTVGSDKIGNATLNIPDKSVSNSCQQWVRDTLSTDLDDSFVILDTGDKNNILKNYTASETIYYHKTRKYSNLCETAVVLRLVTTLVEAGVSADEIGVIAPYREQVELLRSTIKHGVEVNTVDQYQGRDKDIILYSGARSACSRSDLPKDSHILDDHRRLTVAITRARVKLIIIGDVKALKQFAPFAKLFSVIRGKDLMVLKNGCDDFLWEELLSDLKQ